MLMVIVGIGIIIDAVFLFVLIYIKAAPLGVNLFATSHGILIIACIAFFLAIGIALTISGIHALRRFRTVMQAAVRQLIGKGHVNILELSETLSLSEKQVAVLIEKAVVDGYFPGEIEIKRPAGDKHLI
jgi:hypothetical protein